jgi:hypothetical protein
VRAVDERWTSIVGVLSQKWPKQSFTTSLNLRTCSQTLLNSVVGIWDCYLRHLPFHHDNLRCCTTSFWNCAVPHFSSISIENQILSHCCQLSCRTLASFLSVGRCFLSFFPRFAPFKHLIFHSTVWSCSRQRRFDDF